MMTMTEKLATNLIDSLTCLAISAVGYDAYMEDEENLRPAVEEYARKAFMEITNVWENKTGIKWKINLDDKEKWEIE